MLKKYYIIGVLFSCLLMAFSQANAITIQDDFSSIDNWQLNGSAELNNNEAILTPIDFYQFYQAGSIWYKQGFDLSKYRSFRAEFDIFLGCFDKAGADGVTFAVIDISNGLTALGNVGGSLGYGGISNSFAVEFDTYQNSEFNDPPNDHIGIDTNGSLTSLTTANVGNIEDESWHHAIVDFDITTGKISVYLDDTKYIDNYTITNFSPFEAYFGFTGGTGAKYNVQAIDNFKLTLNPVPIPSSVLLLVSGLAGSFYLRRQRKN